MAGPPRSWSGLPLQAPLPASRSSAPHRRTHRPCPPLTAPSRAAPTHQVSWQRPGWLRAGEVKGQPVGRGPYPRAQRPKRSSPRALLGPGRADRTPASSLGLRSSPGPSLAEGRSGEHTPDPQAFLQTQVYGLTPLPLPGRRRNTEGRRGEGSRWKMTDNNRGAEDASLCVPGPRLSLPAVLHGCSQLRGTEAVQRAGSVWRAPRERS